MKAAKFLLDTNVWMALSFAAHEAHDRVVQTFKDCTAEGGVYWCRQTQISFLRLTTTRTIFQSYGLTDNSNHDALTLLRSFAAVPGVDFAEEPYSTESLWQQLAGLDSASPKVWMDAYLAAFCIAGDYTMVSLDRGFSAYESSGLMLKIVS